MKNDRDPITCASCGTVNPWLSEQCRDCGKQLSGSAQKEPALTPVSEAVPERFVADGVGRGVVTPLGADRDSYDPFVDDVKDTGAANIKQHRWNLLWIVLGITFHLTIITVGELIIQKYVIAAEPDLKVMYERIIASKDPQSIGEGAIRDFRTRLFQQVPVVALLLLILISPLLIGAVVGFFSGGVLEGAAAMGISAVIYFFVQNLLAPTLVAGPLFAGLGAAGAYGGVVLRRKLS